MIGSFLVNMSLKLKSMKSCEIIFLKSFFPLEKCMGAQIHATFKIIVIMNPFRHLDDVVCMA